MKNFLTSLKELPELKLPTDYSTVLKVVEAECQFQPDSFFSKSILALILSLSSEEHEPVTPFDILLAFFAILIHRYTGEESFALGSSSRLGSPLLLKLSIQPTDTFENVVRMVHHVCFYLKFRWKESLKK
jgi:L-aminoadipate-semialdehyde dehydrogenase